MGNLGVDACPGWGRTALLWGGWYWHKTRTGQRALLALAEPSEGEWRLCTLIPPGSPSGSLCSQVCFEERRSGRPRSMAWGSDWERLSHAGDRQVLWWRALAPSHPRLTALTPSHWPCTTEPSSLSSTPDTSLPPPQPTAPPGFPLCKVTSQGSILPCHHGGPVPVGGHGAETPHVQLPGSPGHCCHLRYPRVSCRLVPHKHPLPSSAGDGVSLREATPGHGPASPWRSPAPHSRCCPPAPHQTQLLHSTEAPLTPKPAPRTTESEDRRNERKENRSSTFFGYRRQDLRQSISELPEPKVMLSTALVHPLLPRAPLVLPRVSCCTQSPWPSQQHQVPAQTGPLEGLVAALAAGLMAGRAGAESGAAQGWRPRAVGRVLGSIARHQGLPHS